MSDPNTEILLKDSYNGGWNERLIWQGECKEALRKSSESMELLAGHQTGCKFPSQSKVTKAKNKPGRKMTSKKVPDRIASQAPEETAGLS